MVAHRSLCLCGAYPGHPHTLQSVFRPCRQCGQCARPAGQCFTFHFWCKLYDGCQASDYQVLCRREPWSDGPAGLLQFQTLGGYHADGFIAISDYARLSAWNMVGGGARHHFGLAADDALGHTGQCTCRASQHCYPSHRHCEALSGGRGHNPAFGTSRCSDSVVYGSSSAKRLFGFGDSLWNDPDGARLLLASDGGCELSRLYH